MIFNWKEGRLGTGYFRLKILESKLFKFDLYLIKYPVGSCIMFHKDTVGEEFEHHRINFVIKRANIGGDFYLDTWRIAKRLIKFRPDICRHKVTEIKSGIRYVLSFGYLKEKV